MSTEQKDELKIVISLKADRASVGIQAPECDPAFFGLEGDLQATLKAVPKFVEEAKTRWQRSKLYAKCKTPLPSQTQLAPVTSRASTDSRSQRATTQSPQPSMF